MGEREGSETLAGQEPGFTGRRAGRRARLWRKEGEREERPGLGP